MPADTSYTMTVSMRLRGNNIRHTRKYSRIAKLIAGAITHYGGGRFVKADCTVEWELDDYDHLLKPFMRLVVTIESEEPFVIIHEELDQAVAFAAQGFYQLTASSVSHNCTSSYMALSKFPGNAA